VRLVPCSRLVTVWAAASLFITATNDLTSKTPIPKCRSHLKNVNVANQFDLFRVACCYKKKKKIKKRNKRTKQNDAKKPGRVER
jgi:hypothetical protein